MEINQNNTFTLERQNSNDESQQNSVAAMILAKRANPTNPFELSSTDIKHPKNSRFYLPKIGGSSSRSSTPSSPLSIVHSIESLASLDISRTTPSPVLPALFAPCPKVGVFSKPQPLPPIPSSPSRCEVMSPRGPGVTRYSSVDDGLDKQDATRETELRRPNR